MEHDIEIEFISSRHKFLRKYSRNELIQTVPFEIGFLFRNRGSIPLQGATISSIRWHSASGQQILSTIDKSFHLDTLNPGDEKRIWVEKTGTYVYGLCNINLTITSDNVGDTIKTFQVNPFTKEISFCQTNSWTDFFYVKNKDEHEQSITNRYLFVFAVFTLILSIQTWRLSQQQTSYSEVQSRSERIQQARASRDAVVRCKNEPGLMESGLYNLTTGSPTSCVEVLQLDKQNLL